MSNHWTQEEINLTRLAWRLHDMDRHDKFQRVSWKLSVFAIALIVIIAWR